VSSFVWTSVLSFFFSCSLAKCFSFIYLFILESRVVLATVGNSLSKYVNLSFFLLKIWRLLCNSLSKYVNLSFYFASKYGDFCAIHWLNMSTCHFFLPQNMVTFVHFPTRECLYREADFLLILWPKKALCTVNKPTLKFCFPIPNTMPSFRHEKEIKKIKTHTHTHTHTFLACLSGNIRIIIIIIIIVIILLVLHDFVVETCN
jgi:hypothetical protein